MISRKLFIILLIIVSGVGLIAVYTYSKLSSKCSCEDQTYTELSQAYVENLKIMNRVLKEVLEIKKELRNRFEFTILPITNVAYVFVNRNGTVYVGTHTGIAQVWKSIDGGYTWVKIFEDPNARRVTAIYETKDGVLLVGTAWPAKLYISYNGGKTWELKLNLGPGYLRDIIEDRAENLYASHSGTSNNPGAIFKSEDGGRTWVKVWNCPNDMYNLHKMYWDPFTDIIYFSYGTETTGKVAKTTDSFVTVTELPVLRGAFTSIASSFGYRFFAEDSAHMLFRTRDDKVFEGILTRTAFWYDVNGPWAVAVSPLGTLYVGAYLGDKGVHIWASPDMGDTWRVLFRVRGTLVQNFAFSPDGWVYVAITTRPKDMSIRLTEGHGCLIKFRDIPPGMIEPEPMWVDKPFDAAKIRDTEPHYGWWRSGYPDLSVIVCMRGYSEATIAIDNGLDADVVIQVQGSHQPYFDKAPHPEARQVWNLTSEIVVPKGKRVYVVVDIPFPYIRVMARAMTEPTTGEVHVWVFKRR